MNGIAAINNRLGKVEDKISAGDRPSPRILFAEVEESDKDVFARYGIQPDPSQDSLIVSWQSGPPLQMRNSDLDMEPTKVAPPVSDIDAEIEKLFSELEEAGFSRDEVTRMVRQGTDLIREPEKALEHEAPMPAPPEHTESIEAPKAPDLNRLFGGRR